MSVQYVYTMQQLKKVWPGGKEILKDINLSFLPGAKIGVLGTMVPTLKGHNFPTIYPFRTKPVPIERP